MQHPGLGDVYAKGDSKYVALSHRCRPARPPQGDQAIVKESIAPRVQADAPGSFEAAEVTVGLVGDEADLAGHAYVRKCKVLVDLPDRPLGAIPLRDGAEGMP